MVVIELHSRTYNPRERQVNTKLASRIEVKGHSLRVTAGNPEWAEDIKDVVLAHPDGTCDLTFQSDPELWAERLPLALAGSGMTAVAQRKEPVAAEPERVAVMADHI